MKTTTELMNDAISALRKSVDKTKTNLDALDAVVKPINIGYIFKAGDIARSSNGEIRIIVRQLDGDLYSFGEGFCITTTGQKEFESWDYKKIGELKDLLKNFPE